MKTMISHFLFSLVGRLEHFANEATEAVADIFLANAFSADKDHWVQVSPFGDFANVDKKGARMIQRFRKEDAEAICNEFNGTARKILQPLGTPFYVGHPDHPRFKGQAGHTDTAAKGRGKEMAVRHSAECSVCNEFANSGTPCGEHGLFMRVKWNPEGEHLISNEAFHGHSVNWAAVPEGKENGVAIFRPVRVKSIGFTNEPAIPVAPVSLANEQGQPNPEQTATVPPALKLIAGFAEDADVTMDQVIEALQKAKPVETANEQGEQSPALTEMALVLLANASGNDDEAADHADFLKWLGDLLGMTPEETTREQLQGALEEKVAKAGTLDRVKKARAGIDAAHERHIKAMNALEEKLANERKASVTREVDRLIQSGHIVTADRDARIEELANAEDLDAAVTLLANAAPVVKTQAVTAGLGTKEGIAITEARGRTAKFEELMARREQEFPNESYGERFAAVGNSPEGQSILTQMQRPGSDE